MEGGSENKRGYTHVASIMDFTYVLLFSFFVLHKIPLEAMMSKQSHVSQVSTDFIWPRLMLS
jgi:hypothetical protein